MPRRAAGLTAAKVRTAPPGRYGDGGCLYLFVRSAEDRFWTFRYRMPGGKSREMGLGPAGGPAAVPLAEVRQRAAALRAQMRAGIDPLDAKQARAAQVARQGRTFGQVASLYIEGHAAGWRNPKHAGQWRATLATYVLPSMAGILVADVTTAHVMAVVEPLWLVKPETASRVRGRIEAILDYATAQGWRSGENPARWRGHMANLLPARAKVQRVRHHAALPWQAMPALMEDLAQAGGMAALALRFLILTAARSGEARGATWSEIDMQAAIWTVPGERMKAGKVHRVPLSPAALDVLRLVLPLRDRRHGDLVFPGGVIGKPLSDVAVSKALGRDDATVHGMRASFRQWAAEETQFPAEAAELALAHTEKNQVIRAYQRSDLFDVRRPMMGAWAAHCTGTVSPHEKTSKK